MFALIISLKVGQFKPQNTIFMLFFYNCIIFSPLYQNSTIILHILYLFFSMIMYHVFQLLSKSTIYLIYQ